MSLQYQKVQDFLVGSSNSTLVQRAEIVGEAAFARLYVRRNRRVFDGKEWDTVEISDARPLDGVLALVKALLAQGLAVCVERLDMAEDANVVGQLRTLGFYETPCSLAPGYADYYRAPTKPESRIQMQ